MRAREFLSEGFAGIPDKNMPAYKLKKASKGKHKFFLPTDAPVPAGVSALDEYKLDNERGLGSTPNNSNIDYMGFRTMMKPSVFLKLAKPLPEGYRSDGLSSTCSKDKVRRRHRQSILKYRDTRWMGRRTSRFFSPNCSNRP